MLLTLAPVEFIVEVHMGGKRFLFAAAFVATVCYASSIEMEKGLYTIVSQEPGIYYNACVTKGAPMRPAKIGAAAVTALGGAYMAQMLWIAGAQAWDLLLPVVLIVSALSGIIALPFALVARKKRLVLSHSECQHWQLNPLNSTFNAFELSMEATKSTNKALMAHMGEDPDNVWVADACKGSSSIYLQLHSEDRWMNQDKYGRVAIGSVEKRTQWKLIKN